MASDSFSVRIYLQDGDADGVKIVARSKWSGRALVIPRASLESEIGRDELNAPALYILIGPAEPGSGQPVFIGSAAPVSSALQEHAAESDFWSWTIVCAAKDNTLGGDHLKYLEARLIRLAHERGIGPLVNKDIPEMPLLDEAGTAYAESFLGHILSLYPVLGLRVFEQARQESGHVQ